MKDSTIRRENIRLKTELEKKTKDELKATKDKMRKTIFSVDTIRNNDKLRKHYTGFPNFCHNFSHFIAPYRFLWVFQGNTEEMEHGSLVFSIITTVLHNNSIITTSIITTKINEPMEYSKGAPNDDFLLNGLKHCFNGKLPRVSVKGYLL